MAIKRLTDEQTNYCIAAITDVMDYGKTERICPFCGKKLKVKVVGPSGQVWCETPDCVKCTIRGI